MTKTQIAKKAAHMIVALNVASVVETQVDEHTDLDGDSIAVQVGAFVVGNLVANQTDRVTDAAVDAVVTVYMRYRHGKNDDTAVEETDLTPSES
jgi:uncharacterized Zn finger protein